MQELSAVEWLSIFQVKYVNNNCELCKDCFFQSNHTKMGLCEFMWLYNSGYKTQYMCTWHGCKGMHIRLLSLYSQYKQYITCTVRRSVSSLQGVPNVDEGDQYFQCLLFVFCGKTPTKWQK